MRQRTDACLSRKVSVPGCLVFSRGQETARPLWSCSVCNPGRVNDMMPTIYFWPPLRDFHSFENLVLKVKRTRVQDGCTVSFGATVMGGAVI